MVDSNVLIYAYAGESEHHETAKQWLERALAGPEPVGFPWLVLLSFLRILTSPRIMQRAVPLREAAAVVDALLRCEPAVVPHPGARHWEILSELLREARAKGNLVNDAHLAALAVENGAALCSFDRDFRLFPKVRLLTPDEALQSSESE